MEMNAFSASANKIASVSSVIFVHASGVLWSQILHLVFHIAVNSQLSLLHHFSQYSWQLALLFYEALLQHRFVANLDSC